VTERVALSVDEDGLARLTLNRADARNAIDPAMVQALAEATEQAAADPAIRVLLITAEGPVFSVGGDLKYLSEHADRLPAALEPMVGLYHESLRRIAELPMPVVTAAKGAVAGGALGLLWLADVSIVAQDTKLASGFLELGLSGDGGSTWWLPRLVGLQRARELMLYRGQIFGSTAADWGLVTSALPEDEVDAGAERAARALAERPPKAYAEIRALLAASFERDLQAGLEAEHRAMLSTAATDDASERIEGFGR
jgi:2-(1,2-epoxy-1,2-dihydrophenyl)acetyl-CoA isomerase